MSNKNDRFHHEAGNLVLDWGDTRSPSNTEGDGGVAVVAIPPNTSHCADDVDFDISEHNAEFPLHLITDGDIDMMSDERRVQLLRLLLQRERKQVDTKNELSYAREKFSLERDRTRFTLVKYLVAGFAVIAGLSFIGLMMVLLLTSYENGEITDTSALGSILTTLTEIVKILFAPTQ